MLFFWHSLQQFRVRACTQGMASVAKIDQKYGALGSQSRVASRGDPEMTALLLIIHHLVKIATK